MNVFLSPIAERKLELLLEHLEFERSKNSRDKFLAKIVRTFKQISIKPKSCRESELFPNLYKCIVTKQTSFYYRIRSTEIEIITIIDNRQSPDKTWDELQIWLRN